PNWIAGAKGACQVSKLGIADVTIASVPRTSRWSPGTGSAPAASERCRDNEEIGAWRSGGGTGASTSSHHGGSISSSTGSIRVLRGQDRRRDLGRRRCRLRVRKLRSLRHRGGGPRGRR